MNQRSIDCLNKKNPEETPPYESIYTKLQDLYRDIDELYLDQLSYDERISLLLQLEYLSSLPNDPENDQQIIDYLNSNDNITLSITNYLDISNKNKIALIMGVSAFTFTDNVPIIHIKNDYLNLIQNLTNEGYHVNWLLEEYMNPYLLNQTVNRFDQYDTINTQFFNYISSVAAQEELENGTKIESFVLYDGSLLKDKDFNVYFNNLNSKNQFFIINTCHAEGFAEELEQDGRLILAATEKDQIQKVTMWDIHTPFYQLYRDNWDMTLSVEENYLILCEESTTYEIIVILIDPDEENDYYM